MVSLIGCGVEEESVDERTEAMVVVQGQQMQGAQLQGAQLQGAQLQGVDVEAFRLDRVVLGGEGLAAVRVEKGGLVGSRGGLPLAGRDLVGVVLTGEAQVTDAQGTRTVSATFRIADVHPENPAHDPSGGTWLYRVEQWLPETTTWSPMCNADSAGDRLAIPMAGVFDRTGARIESKSRFTFACTAGVIAKCYRWGYRPWLVQAGDPGFMARVHWACTRMARADYCGNGVAHTHNGILINIWDNITAPLGPVQRRDAAPTMVFEAGWSTSGAACLGKDRRPLLDAYLAQACPERRLPIVPVAAPKCAGQPVVPQCPRGVLVYNDSELAARPAMTGP